MYVVKDDKTLELGRAFNQHVHAFYVRNRLTTNDLMSYLLATLCQLHFQTSPPEFSDEEFLKYLTESLHSYRKLWTPETLTKQ